MRAADLTHDAIGKKVEVDFQRGNVKSTVTDQIQSVTHERGGVRIRFSATAWRGINLLGNAPDEGLLVGREAQVRFLDD